MLSQLMQFVVQHWAIVAVLAGVAFVFCLARLSGNEGSSAFERRGALVTESELRFYRALAAAVGGSWSVFPMVRLADVVKVRKGIIAAQTWRNRTFGKHVDFVLCDNDSLNVRLAIELDDVSHEQPSRQQRDTLVNQALRSAGLPLLRVPVAETYDKIALRKAIDQILAKK
jgi:very-short-patch-repair endonuclease